MAIWIPKFLPWCGQEGLISSIKELITDELVVAGTRGGGGVEEFIKGGNVEGE